MSLQVFSRERPREFDVYVGEKRVGRIKLYRSGWYACHRVKRDDLGAESESYISHSDSMPRTMRRAVARVLADQGFGRSDGFVRDAMRKVR